MEEGTPEGECSRPKEGCQASELCLSVPVLDINAQAWKNQQNELKQKQAGPVAFVNHLLSAGEGVIHCLRLPLDSYTF